MNLEISRILAPVTALGFGRRLGLWVQGCRLACAGCASVDTWNTGVGEHWNSDDLAALVLREVRAKHLDGLTITGGEPLDQSGALAHLVETVRAGLVAHVTASPFDVLLFTGYPTGSARKRANGLWNLVDAAVCGPYRRSVPSDAPLVSTRNQELVLLSDLGRDRYPLSEGAPRMQVVAEGEDLIMIGLPRPGELNVLAEKLQSRGVLIGRPSWLS